MNRPRKIEILSRRKLADLLTYKDFISSIAIIEIKNHWYEDELSLSGVKAHLELVFNDVSDPDGGAMTREQAKEIVAFVRSLEETTPIYVSCMGGISRSPAVAAAIVFSEGYDDWYIWRSICYSPSSWCYTLLLEAFGVDKSDVMEKVELNRGLQKWVCFDSSNLVKY